VVVGGVDVLGGARPDLLAGAETPVRTLELARGLLLDACLDRFDVLATVAAGIAAVALAARRRLGPEAGFARPDDAARRTRPHLTLGERIRFLGALPALVDTPVRPLAHVATAMEPLAVNPGHHFWRAGDAADHLVVLVAGTVACRSGDGAQRFTLGPRDAVGLLDMLAGAPRWYDARAAGRVVALRIARPALADVLEDESEATLAVVEGLARATVDLLRAAAEGVAPY
jgi:CRP-like cAMP-binding protein